MVPFIFPTAFFSITGVLSNKLALKFVSYHLSFHKTLHINTVTTNPKFLVRVSRPFNGYAMIEKYRVCAAPSSPLVQRWSKSCQSNPLGLTWLGNVLLLESLCKYLSIKTVFKKKNVFPLHLWQQYWAGT